jgi:hypothetical protein
MSATVPSREFVLPTSPTLQAKPTVIADRKWMAHLAKHPLGANALRQHKPWNDEGFDQLSPPTVDHDERERFLSLIRDADSRGGACGVREFARGPIETSEGEPACYSDSVAQLNRSDGLRISFYLRGRSLSWRTTFRKVPVSPTAAVRTLLDVPRDESMSATFLVARPWWQQQQVPLR